MKIVLKHVFILLVVLSPVWLGAQGFIDIARLDATRGLMGNDYDELNGLNFALQIPILLPSKDAILTGFSMEGTGVEDAFSDYKARNMTLSLGANVNLKEGRPLTVATFHRMNSDQFTVDGSAYQFALVALYTYQKKEHAEFRLGFYTNTEFMGQLVTPLFGIDWKISPKLRFYGVLPATGTISYQYRDNWFIGADFLGIFQTYRQPSDGDFYLQRAVNLGSLFSEYYLTDNIVFNVKVGLLVGSGYKLFEEGDKIDWALNLVKFGDDRTELDRIKTDGIVAKAGLVFRFNIENQ